MAKLIARSTRLMLIAVVALLVSSVAAKKASGPDFADDLEA